MSGEPGVTEQAEFLVRLGQRVRELRRARKLSQEKLAFACDLTQHYVSQIEKGEPNVSILTVRELAKALEVSLDGLLGGLS